MQTFLATLAQVSATLLGIFLAAIVAYFVFLHERYAGFLEQIEALQLNIASELTQLRATSPPTIYSVPAEFEDRYRRRYPDKGEPALILQLATDLTFERPEVAAAFQEASGDHNNPALWRGRVYFFILAEIVRLLTGSDIYFRPKVFPASPAGLGFEQWRENFNEVQGIIPLLLASLTAMTSDYKAYLHQIAALDSDGVVGYSNKPATQFF